MGEALHSKNAVAGSEQCLLTDVISLMVSLFPALSVFGIQLNVPHECSSCLPYKSPGASTFSPNYLSEPRCVGLFILFNLWLFSVSLRWPGAYLIVGPETRLPGVGPSRARASDRSPNSMVGGVAQDVGVSVGWESNYELLSWGPVVLPVVHDIILQWQ